MSQVACAATGKFPCHLPIAASPRADFWQQREIAVRFAILRSKRICTIQRPKCAIYTGVCSVEFDHCPPVSSEIRAPYLQGPGHDRLEDGQHRLCSPKELCSRIHSEDWQAKSHRSCATLARFPSCKRRITFCSPKPDRFSRSAKHIAPSRLQTRSETHQGLQASFLPFPVSGSCFALSEPFWRGKRWPAHC